jgi:NAD(P)-dependent dehydrogenase (short-subunit alcohol dehydrogenase family)
MKLLQGKTAIITGAARGIGEAVARATAAAIGGTTVTG